MLQSPFIGVDIFGTKTYCRTSDWYVRSKFLDNDVYFNNKQNCLQDTALRYTFFLSILDRVDQMGTLKVRSFVRLFINTNIS